MNDLEIKLKMNSDCEIIRYEGENTKKKMKYIAKYLTFRFLKKKIYLITQVSDKC